MFLLENVGLNKESWFLIEDVSCHVRILWKILAIDDEYWCLMDSFGGWRILFYVRVEYSYFDV